MNTNPEMMLPPTSATNTVTSSSSTAAVAIGGNGWYTFSVKTSDVHILFGSSAVAAASTSNALYLPAGTVKDWYIPPDGTTHFRVIAAAAGLLSWTRSGP